MLANHPLHGVGVGKGDRDEKKQRRPASPRLCWIRRYSKVLWRETNDWTLGTMDQRVFQGAAVVWVKERGLT